MFTTLRINGCIALILGLVIVTAPPPAVTAADEVVQPFGGLSLATSPLSNDLILDSNFLGLKLPAGNALSSVSLAGLPSSANVASPSPTAFSQTSTGQGPTRTAYLNIYDYTGRTSNGGYTWGNYINQVIHADRFYQTGVLDDQNPNNIVGIFGQGTYTAQIDAGHPWAGTAGHSTLSGVVVDDPNMRFSPTDSATGQSLVVTDPQAHATEVAMTIAGAGGELRTGTTTVRLGIAPLTNLCSGAIATSVATDGSGSFDMTPQTYLAAYQHFAEATWNRTINYSIGSGVSLQATISGPTDVISSSFGFDDPAGIFPETIAVDALARAHPKTTFVVSAGNSGPNTNSVGGPASGYNVISVGAVGDGTLSGINTVATFSSRGPQDAAGSPAGPIIHNARAPVDIVAPGYYIVTATYDGPGTDPNAAVAASGTSFSAPIVAAGVSLLDSLSYHLSESYLFANFDNSRDSRVIKAVLLNSADKLPGWDNAQHAVSGVTRTEQALDMAQGAGRVNMSRAFDQYLAGTLDPYGVAGAVAKTGWSLAALKYHDPSDPSSDHKDYAIVTPLTTGNYLDATLTWFRNRSLPGLASDGNWASGAAENDLGAAELNLEIWDATFQHLYAVSDSPYDDVQHLHYLLPENGSFGLRVWYADQLFGTADPAGETFGLAWNVVPVPEPSTLVLLAVGLLGWAWHTRRPRR